MADTPSKSRRIAPATIALALAAMVALVAIVGAATRSNEAADAAAAAGASAPPDAPGNAQAASADQMIASLRQRVTQNPDDAAAWHLLGLALRDSQAYPAAEQAFRRAMQLQPNNPDHVASLGEAVLLLGREDPPREAESLFRRALELRRDHPQARFYLAVLKDIGGEHRQAVDDLIALLGDAPAGASWVPQVRGAAQAIARQNGIDIAGRLPEPAPVRPGAQPGPPPAAALPAPNRQQMEAARNMPAAQQDQMVKAMVDRLAARLQQNPRDEAGWTMLMRSRIAQGDPAGATQALRSGVAAFGNDAAAQQRLRAAAQQLRVPSG
jgi:cytochrome c-type biogenesis protein CcmH